MQGRNWSPGPHASSPRPPLRISSNTHRKLYAASKRSACSYCCSSSSSSTSDATTYVRTQQDAKAGGAIHPARPSAKAEGKTLGRAPTTG
eukprot:353939-Chlamydomonas_euryale.AAC.17